MKTIHKKEQLTMLHHTALEGVWFNQKILHHSAKKAPEDEKEQIRRNIKLFFNICDDLNISYQLQNKAIKAGISGKSYKEFVNSI